ncbi:MAG: hypothetical protein ABIA78_04015 [archaeon]
MGVTSNSILETYTALVLTLPQWAQSFINFLILVLIIVAYSIFVWKLYRFISKKNPLGLDLNKYNKTQQPSLSKITNATLYFAEYILILPFIIFGAFMCFTFFLVALSQSEEITKILVISATVIAAIRITAYYKESLSQELAKLLPFTLLAISVLNPNFFSETHHLERIITQINQIPDSFDQVIYYLIFIIILEIILRLFDFIYSLFGFETEVVDEENELVKK